MQPFTRFTLPNGLLVLLKEIHTAPVISHWVWYRVGSRDEIPGKTGISHWVEHMQFKGTLQFPASVLDRAISRDGGYWNALTHLDWTTYYETLPADKIELALRLESDRMANSLFNPDEVASERTVIISERQGHENEPMFRLGEEIQSAAFRVHSYHHEIIGDMDDLRTMSREDLYNHYRTYYHPGNAVLAVAGDFDTQALLESIYQYYGDLPAGPQPPRLQRTEPVQAGERRVTVEGPGDTTYLELAYHAPAAADPDFLAMMALDSLLSGPGNLNLFGEGISNKTSRLYQALVERELAVALHGGLQASIDPYLLTFTAIVRPDKTAESVIGSIDAEIARLQENPPGEAEVARAVKQARALFAYGSERITNQAFWLGFSHQFADYDWYTGYLERLAAVTPADIQRMAQKYLRPQNRVVGIYLPNGSPPNSFEDDLTQAAGVLADSEPEAN